jgi:hypothetical protein
MERDAVGRLEQRGRGEAGLTLSIALRASSPHTALIKIDHSLVCELQALMSATKSFALPGVPLQYGQNSLLHGPRGDLRVAKGSCVISIV